jgi:predicted nucleic acid-binding protein
VAEIWVVNASPIITLAKVGHLDLLTRLTDEVLVPSTVASEVLAGPISDPARKALQEGWGKTVAVERIPAPILEWSLGAGESAVLSLVLNSPGATAVLDDAVGRRCARTLDVPVIGTLAVVLRAKKRGLIPSAAQVVQSLVASGLHVDQRTAEVVLKRLADEEWRAGDD